MIIRTLGLYQPFCSLMFHGKIETRWVRKGKKPSFPLGRYLFYSTKKSAGDMVFAWCTVKNMEDMEVMKEDETRLLNGYGLGFGDLVEVRLMTIDDEEKGFVKFVGEKTVKDKNDNDVVMVQWALIFENPERVEPFPFDAGKQGVGILKQPYLAQLGY